MRHAILLFTCGLAGCQAAPLAVAPPVARPTPLVRLFRHDVPVEREALRQEILQVAIPGTPVELARARLEAEGFRLFSFLPKSYRRHAANLPELLSGFDEKAEKQANSVQFFVLGDDARAWGQRVFELRPVVYFDENMNVRDVGIPYVPDRARPTPFAWFFTKGEKLCEPVGMPLERARQLMEREGFRCTQVDSDKREKSGRPFLLCRAVAETALGGSIVRVRLFYDDAGIVTDTRVLKDAEFGDEIVCMLPNQDDSVEKAVFKTVIFPVRLYAALVVGGLEADLAMGRP